MRWRTLAAGIRQGGEESAARALTRHDQPASRRNPRPPWPGPMGKRRTAGGAARRRHLARDGSSWVRAGSGGRWRRAGGRAADRFEAGGPRALATPRSPEKAALEEAAQAAPSPGAEDEPRPSGSPALRTSAVRDFAPAHSPGRATTGAGGYGRIRPLGQVQRRAVRLSPDVATTSSRSAFVPRW
jgi:hypothetical protein